MNYDIELYKRQILVEAEQDKQRAYDKYANLIPQSTALVDNGRAIPIDMLRTDISILLYCHLQFMSNWNDTETHRYVWREYYKIRNLIEKLKGKYSKLSSTATVSKKLNELISSEYVEEKYNCLILKNSYFEGKNFALINQDTLAFIVAFKDELLTRVYCFYVFMWYINGQKPFICRDNYLCKNINYKYMPKNRQRLSDIRDMLLRHGVIELATVTKIDPLDGNLKTTNIIRLLKL